MPRKKAVPDDAPETKIIEAEVSTPMQKDDLMERVEERFALVKRDESAVDVHPEVVRKKLAAIRAFQELIRHELIEGQDYGTIPGTPKPTLLKPGAEKIVKLMDLADEVIVEDKIEDWQAGFFYYRTRVELRSLITNQVVATGIGSCNSKEDKYHWRWIPEQYLNDNQRAMVEQQSLPFKIRRSYGQEQKVYRFENEEIFTQVNTLLKMAKKRALVDAALSVGRLSNLFTQDIEDGAEGDFFTSSPRQREESAPKRKPGPKPRVSTDSQEPAKAPEPASESHPLVDLTLSNGSKVSVDKFKALDYYKALKQSLNKATGDDATYYATLEQFGYKHANDIPLEEVPGVWDTMVSVWKMYQNKKQKGEKEE